MSLELVLCSHPAEDGSGDVVFTVELRNRTDELVVFHTPTGELFKFTVEEDIHVPCFNQMTTQAFRRRELSPGATLTFTYTWECEKTREERFSDIDLLSDDGDRWEDVPEDFDSITVSVEVNSSDDPVGDLRCTETFSLPP